ncbi:MAG: AAA family ATPase [Microcystis panniformis Mp_MB_F_20051200_S9]|uniref:AAA family ATPase n=1 Tax=Microcystis panniformis Mp_MB_F_20051200_S9 TaxID=2486223 RepID=A0A552Q6A3_9CHRO|nr:MAG: AAA family ATPase [Microcystis panniformis Mp_MB_F_20080800_S26D]TRV51097.1 MAG: AAA family ATPase [Microcystis panniformis Mp_GB_SS_20050300_S99]TRV56052.1 MAG: AAA family ATPase [Microcystis panniformis Mp_GB_SS_20050300_S99D]TRV56802.1 MAG: AAA family ATPase [Microcystis panniformis Mp_MB_F_20080800_S26]TRV64728.1 MAG: AAA family ATPase [Microcystis panniformis Mp_MB_F_20051200_S9]TRV68280.1 MAG: AAA family ATPase [Microcystis panniformis Mp_MB_F_20051200_S9D]TRV70955.1 MAG: AAA fa
MAEETKSVHWQPFNGRGEQLPASETLNLPPPPPWRKFNRPIPSGEKDTKRRSDLLELVESEKTDRDRGEKFRLSEISDNEADSKNTELQKAIDLVIAGVNAALCLRRPLLVTGRPGSGKTSLAYALAYQLRLGPVLKWSITARTTLQDGLYRYDAIARLQEPESEGKQDIGSYITLGALGTAFLPSALPRVLLIDEIDKSDINLPNDLLNLFEEGEYEIPELKRWTEKNPSQPVSVFTWDKNLHPVELNSGIVGCHAFPIVVMTSNGERDFPPAFKRRCIRIKMPNPGINNLKSIVKSHMGDEYFDQSSDRISQLITDFLGKEKLAKDLATDQLLNVVYMLTGGAESTLDCESLKELLFKSLNDTEGL